MRNICDNRNPVVSCCPFSSWPASTTWHSLLEAWSSDWRAQLEPDFPTILLVLFSLILARLLLVFLLLSDMFSAPAFPFSSFLCRLYCLHELIHIPIFGNYPCAEDPPVFISGSLYLIQGRPLCSTVFISLIWNEHFKPEHVPNQILCFPPCLLITYSFPSFWQPQSSGCSNATIYCVLFSSLMTQYGFLNNVFGFYLKRISRVWPLLTWSLFSGPCQHSVSSGSLQ